MHEIEQKAGKALVAAVDAEAVDSCRKETYLSYESFLRAHLHTLDAERAALWQRDYSNSTAYEESVEPMRQRFAEMLGFWQDPADRPPVSMGTEEVLWQDEHALATRFSYEVRPGLHSYAVRMRPKTKGPHPGLVVQHGYMGTPEMACGLVESANAEDYAYRSMGLRAVQRGYCVIAPHHPSGYGTESDAVDVPLPNFPDRDVHYGKNRLHRLCVLAGGTLLGLDMLASSRAVDMLVQDDAVDSSRIGCYGLSRGGQTALFLPALDRRVRASVCSAYFNERLPKLIGPYSRTNYIDWFAEGQILPAQAQLFADADIVSLIAPRAFAVEAGLGDGAVDQEASRRECERARVHYEQLGLAARIEFVDHAEGHVAATGRAFEFLDEQLS
ncbi:MAG: dienelactone hydrolase [Planctomycetota bacterium]|jgi:dienelactone hydrolase